MTDKVFVTKENLQKALDMKEKSKVGFFTSICIVLWLIALFPFFAGIILTSLLMLLFALPLYALDQLFIRRIKKWQN